MIFVLHAKIKYSYFVVQSTFNMDAQEQLNQLSEIRSLMERSSRFLSLSGLAGISAGVIALLSGFSVWFYLGDGVLQHPVLLTKRFFALAIDSSEFQIVALIGVATLTLAVLSAFYFSRIKAKKKQLNVWDATTKRLLINLFIPLLTGGIFCLALVFHGLFYLIASATLVFYGLALINASRYTLNEIRYLGFTEIALGILCSFFVGYGIVFWLLGFGLMHIIYGVTMYNKYDR